MSIFINSGIGYSFPHSKRGGLGKVSITYQGVYGYRVAEEFKGTLPPQESVRVYRLLWHQAPPAIDDIVLRDSFLENHQLPERKGTGNEGIDYLPIPTMRTISPEFIPCVVATLRDIVRGYMHSDYVQRNQVWHRLLSAMKLSLATIRTMDKRSTRRDPINTKSNTTIVDSEITQDIRAIKKAKRLVLEGCATKGENSFYFHRSILYTSTLHINK